MSFILRFFREPSITSVAAAARYVYESHPPLSEPNPHYALFVRSVSEYFPDLSNDEDAADKNLWPEGLDDSPCYDVVINLLINLDMLDPGVMSVIARAAYDSGLQILDEQNGLLYGPTPGVIGIRQKKQRPLPDITDYARSVMTENVRGLRLKNTQQRIADALASVDPTFARAEADRYSVLSRPHGELRQHLAVNSMGSTDRKSIRIYIQLGFTCDALRDVWLPLLPASFADRLKRYDALEGGEALQLVTYLPSITSGNPAQTSSLRPNSDVVVTDAMALDSLISVAQPWARAELLPFLGEIRSVNDLCARFINDTMLEHCRIGRVAFPIYPTVLTLARHQSRDALDTYAAAYRSNKDLARLGTLFKDPACAHFEQLVAGLREMGD
jgi:hypothetical protein